MRVRAKPWANATKNGEERYLMQTEEDTGRGCPDPEIGRSSGRGRFLTRRVAGVVRSLLGEAASVLPCDAPLLSLGSVSDDSSYN